MVDDEGGRRRPSAGSKLAGHECDGLGRHLRGLFQEGFKPSWLAAEACGEIGGMSAATFMAAGYAEWTRRTNPAWVYFGLGHLAHQLGLILGQQNRSAIFGLSAERFAECHLGPTASHSDLTPSRRIIDLGPARPIGAISKGREKHDPVRRRFLHSFGQAFQHNAHPRSHSTLLLSISTDGGIIQSQEQ